MDQELESLMSEFEEDMYGDGLMDDDIEVDIEVDVLFRTLAKSREEEV